MSWLPDRHWWLTPSGGPYPNPDSFWTIVTEAPLPAHAIGGFLAAVLLLPFLLPLPILFKFYWACVLVMIWHQAMNVERLNWHNYGFKTMAWRVLIGAVPLGLVMLGVSWLTG